MGKNILIICADQLRADCLGVYGNRQVLTPHLDALSQGGAVYENHFTVYPVCTPSRYSFLSGMYVHQHGAWTNESTLPQGYDTFPEILKQNGWRTAAVGKMHMTPTYQDVGYETMLLAEQNGVGRFEDDYHEYLMREGLIDRVDLKDQWNKDRDLDKESAYYTGFGAGPSDLSLKDHSTTWIMRQALEEIRQNWSGRGNHLLYVSFIKPHHPFDPPEPYASLYAPEKMKILPGFTEQIPEQDEKEDTFFDYHRLTKKALRKVMAEYYGNITMMDDAVGEIIGELKTRNLYDETMIVFTSDHGEYLGFHHLLLKGNHLYDPLARIPLIIKYPDRGKIKGRCGALSENIDVSSTVLAEAGLQPADSMQGIDLRRKGREFVFSEGQYGTAGEPCIGYMIRSAHEKLLIRGSMENVMFFDLAKDPAELVNLADNPEYQEDIQRHKDELIQRMLFAAGGVNHVDRGAAVTQSREYTDQRRKKLYQFVSEQFNKSPR